jgi:DNA mismatch endonuclease (patch repair protein)
MNKIEGNRERDKRTEEKLLMAGWRLLTIWECALKGARKRRAEDIIDEIAEWIVSISPAEQLTINHR